MIFLNTGNAGKLAEFQNHFAHGNLEPLVGLRALERASDKTYTEPEEEFDSFLENGAVKLFHSLKYIATHRDKFQEFAISKVLVDDSGLCVPALEFKPGVHSAYFGGLPRSDSKNRQSLINALKGCEERCSAAQKSEMRTDAFFVCFLFSIELHDTELRLFSDFENHDIHVTDFAKKLEKTLLESATQACAQKKSGGSQSVILPVSDFIKTDMKVSLNVDFGFCAGQVSTTSQNLVPGAGHGYDALFYGNENPTHSFASITLEEKNRVSHRAQALKAFC